MNSGVYIITNIINNKYYIGSSYNIKKRFSTHKNLLKKGTHHSIHLQRAYNKHGIDNFEFKVLEYAKDGLLQKEQEYIDLLLPKYNIAKNTLAPMKDRNHSEKTKIQMRTVIRPKGKNHGSYGRKLNPEHVEKVRRALIGSKRNSITKNKMSKTAKKIKSWKRLKNHIELLKKSIIDSNGNEFESLSKCANYWKISVQTVCDILKGRHLKTRNKISFKYKES